jgi:hypothetical protein
MEKIQNFFILDLDLKLQEWSVNQVRRPAVSRLGMGILSAPNLPEHKEEMVLPTPFSYF